MAAELMCRGEDYPFHIGIAYEEWPLPDPKGMPIEHVRVIRDAVFDRVREIVVRKGWARDDVRLNLP